MKAPDTRFDAWLDASTPPDVSAALHALTGRDFRPSAALFQLDPDVYAEQRADWIDMRVTQALTDNLPSPQAKRNVARFGALSELVARSCIVPFVGAGLSIPCGMPTWSDFLLTLGAECKKKQTIRTLLRDARFEDAATRLTQELGPNAIQERYRTTFRLSAPVAGPVGHLARIAKRAVVTTNFDSVLEVVFGSALRPVFLGTHSSDFVRCLSSGQVSLLKLHGDIEIASSRVLTRAEYDRAYGKASRLNLGLPLPRGLRKLFSTFSLLFVGCSLAADRTMDVFAKITFEEEVGHLPQHYALLARGSNAPTERFLADRNIFPIWYPSGRHEVVATLLEYLAMESAG